ncbi:acyl carrier protein [Lewinella marina]|uniref:Carrier domain-containing protein n=1 Tax=Neolewinella marina TaxID=438751 RepID=A0A2G0CDI8_9BACT|nr:acyl carrier protein [Neolewinella marina]NJB85986.1 acyl carrier protein [Neolewinella marina]PHK98046.1 hypothetical protein CGL56_12710 [Neolewinella marina]
MEERILTFIKNDLLDDGQLDLTPEDDVLTTGLVSSLAVFRLIDFLEQTFRVRIPAEEMTIENFISVAAMSNYVRSRQTEQQV